MEDLSEHFARRSESLPYRSGVGLVVRNLQGKVLVGEANDFYEIWKMPQGGIEAGESPEDAALRELKEETGISGVTIAKAAKGKLSYDYPEGPEYMPGFRGQEFQWYLVEVDSENFDLESEENDEFSGFRWVSPQEAIQLAHNEDDGDPVTLQRQKMYKRVFAEFGMLEPEQSLDQTLER